MFTHELDGLKKLGLPVKRWGDSYRIKVRGKTGRFVYVSDVSKSFYKQQIAKLYPKAFPRNTSITERVNVLKEAVSKPKKAYSKSMRKTKVIHKFDHMPQQEVFSELAKTLRNEKKAFKVAIELAYNLTNIETGEKIYWTPGWSTRIQDNSITINKKSDIQTKIVDMLSSADLASKIKYPSSKYKLDEITGIQAVMFYRDHKLGNNLITIPEIIKKNSHIVDFPKTENKCMFHCIAFHLQTEGRDFRRIQSLVKDRFKQYCSFKSIEYTLPLYKSFKPIDILQFDELEECFQLSINVYNMDIETGSVDLIRESDSSFENKINILDHNGHAMYIPRIDALLSKYLCNKCDMIFANWEGLANHKKSQCQTITREVFCKTPTAYRPAENRIKSLLDKYDVKHFDHYIDHFIVYDFEAILMTINEQRGESTKYTNKHVPVSVSICNSLTNEVRCLISDDPKDLLTQMFDYVHTIASDIYEYNLNKFKDLFKAILKVSSSKDENTLNDICQQVPVVGFNSGRYDLNLVKNYIFAILGADNIKCVIRNPSYMCISTDDIKMLDIINYLPAGTSYDSYLKTYLGGCLCPDQIRCTCGLAKGVFCYEYITSFEKLNEAELPPRGAFDSKLKSTRISDDDYKRLQFVWDHYEMKSIKDLLRWYNNLDVSPFVKAIQIQRKQYKKFGLDMLSDGVSLPSLAEKVMYQTLYKQLKPIERQYGNAFSFPTKRFAGYRKQDMDANRKFNMSIDHVNDNLIKQQFSCLHCGCALSSENASADRINNFKGHIDGNIIISCIDCNKARKTMSIQRFGYMKQVEANANRLVWSIDADNKDIFHKMKANIAGGPSIIFNRYAKRNETYIRNGDKLVKKVIGYDANALYLWALGGEMPCGKLTTMDPHDSIIDDIKLDKLFGFLECDIETPEHLKDYFEEMTPIFKNIEIDPTDVNIIGEHMHSYNMSREHKNTLKSRKLIGSYFGTKILIYTPLLKWYLNHGLVVTKSYSFIKANPHRAFEGFMNKVSDARRMGDSNKNHSMIAEMMKLIGNSAFGRSGIDKSKHKETKYVDNKESVAKLVEQNRFYDVEELDGSFEVTLKKRTMKLNNPIHLSIAIYQLAKLRMLQFYYDCIDLYFDRSDFQYQEMDTDSAYIAFSDENPFENIVKPELKQHFIDHKYDWFPRDDTKENAAFDKRTPGLFKEEWRGNAIVSLSSKNYICYMPDDKQKIKISSKGVQGSNDIGDNRRNKLILNPDAFENVVTNRICLSATNSGFRIDKATQGIITYQQTKIGLNYWYDKRRVLDDGISTIPLDI